MTYYKSFALTMTGKLVSPVIERSFSCLACGRQYHGLSYDLDTWTGDPFHEEWCEHHGVYVATRIDGITNFGLLYTVEVRCVLRAMVRNPYVLAVSQLKPVSYVRAYCDWCGVPMNDKPVRMYDMHGILYPICNSCVEEVFGLSRVDVFFDPDTKQIATMEVSDVSS